MDIRYTVNTAAEKVILEHLSKADEQFIPPLSSKVDIEKYVKKICSHAVRLEAWSEDHLIGLLAVYLNNNAGGVAFITNVSVTGGFQGQGIATRLLEDCMEMARKSGFRKVILEVSSDNLGAMALYRKFNFESDSVTEGNAHTMSRDL